MLSTTTRTVSQYLPFGYLSGELTVFNKTKYLNLNQSEDTNKHLIQFISYFDVPVADIEDIESNSNDDSNYFYFAPKETTERIGGYYTYFDGEENISLSDNFLMYPKITFRNWKNDRNSTSFEVVPYDDWDLVSDMGIVNPNKIDWEWKRKLMELTLSYIKYGKPGKLTENDQIKIDNVVDAIWNNPNSYSIVSRNFNGSYIIIAIRFNKTIFDPSSGVDINIIEVA
jgi:hypothetical protein